MIPKVIFRYSWIYDQLRREEFEKKSKNYPSPKETLNYIKKADKIWKKYENKILKEISRITELEWEEKEIQCYVVGGGMNFSDPLTISPKKELSYFIDVLTHELIHRIFAPKKNYQKSEKAWIYINKKYKKETWNTRVHIVIHAIHKYIFLKFFGEKRLEREIKIMNKFPEYKRAWEIIQKEGYQNIIKEFKEKIK